MKVQRLFYVLISMSLMMPHSSWAWGDLGHRTIAIVAIQNLSDNAKAEASRILGYDISSELPRWSKEAVWADQVKLDPKWKYMSPYHYADHAQGKSYWETLPAPGGDAFRALLKFSESITFRDEFTSRDDKATALRMIMHLVGDLHQPLHTGEKENRGGNDIPVGYIEGFECPKDQQVDYDNGGHKLNLHLLWDYIVPRYDYYMNCENAEDAESPLQYATCLESRFNSIAWNSLDLQDWLKVNEDITDKNIKFGDLMAIDGAYLEQASSKAGLLIYLAGIRLAKTLDEVLARGHAPEEYSTFYRKVKQAFGEESFAFFKLKPLDIKTASKENKKSRSSSR
jgi:hypothetical protein